MAQIKRSGQMFAAEVGEWCLDMKDRTKRVWQEATIDFCEYMNRPVMRGGHMPMLYGFLRSSLMVSTSPLAFGTVPRPFDEPVYPYFPNRIEAAVRAARVGQTLHIGYMAEYVDAQEYGWGGNPGRGFQRLAIQHWPTIVAETERRIMAS